MKIHTNLDLIQEYPRLPTATILYPFLGIFPEPFHERQSPMAHRFDEFCGLAPGKIGLADEENSDFFLFPFEWYGLSALPGKEELLTAFFSRATQFGKQGVFFAYGDERVDLSQFENALVFQSNLSRSNLLATDRAMPAFVEDMFASRGYVSPRSGNFLSRLGMRRRPKISFCGYPSSAPVREVALKVFAQSKLVRSNFELRGSYFGGAWDKKIANFDFRKLKSTRREYVSNLFSGDYALCVRGWGNYSARFYEAMCCGKIPVLIDTDCVLPFAREIDYEKLILRIPVEQVAHADEILAEFDASLDDETFLRRQQECRRTWKEYLSPSGFLLRIDRLIQQ